LSIDHVLHQSSSRLVATSGIMTSGTAPRRLRRDIAGRLEDRARLHLVDFGIGDAQAAAAMAEHRVELVQFTCARFSVVDADADAFGHFLELLVGMRQEFVQRRIEQADGDRQAGHHLENLA
jgi:hypothetical protein